MQPFPSRLSPFVQPYPDQGMGNARATTKEQVAAAIGRSIRRRRKELNMSQEALAEKANFHRTYISGIEAGTRNITVSSMVRIARALELTASELCRELG